MSPAGPRARSRSRSSRRIVLNPQLRRDEGHRFAEPRGGNPDNLDGAAVQTNRPAEHVGRCAHAPPRRVAQDGDGHVRARPLLVRRERPPAFERDAERLKKLAVTMFTNTRRVDEPSVIPAKANVCAVSDAKTSNRVRRSA